MGFERACFLLHCFGIAGFLVGEKDGFGGRSFPKISDNDSGCYFDASREQIERIFSHPIRINF